VSAIVYTAACHSGIRHPARAVLKELAWFADDNGQRAFPSVTTLAVRTGLSRRAVQKLLRELERIGAIDAVGSRLGGRGRASGGRGRSTHYRINLERLKANQNTANEVRPCVLRQADKKGEPDDTQRANSRAENSEPHAPEQKEYEYEYEEKQDAPFKGRPGGALTYEHQRLRQATWKKSRLSQIPSPPSERELEARRTFLLNQAERLKTAKRGSHAAD
jgi:DNA-binding Lrp family transcriptional regulator